MMRQIISVLFVSLLLAATVAAGPQVKFGAKAGVVMATMTGDGWDKLEEINTVTIEEKYLVSPVGGVFAEVLLGTSGVSIQPEILYVMKGAKGEITEGSRTYTLKIKSDYVEVPVLMKYNFTTAGKVFPFLFAGPVAAFNVGAKVQYQDPPEDDPDLGDKDIDNANSVDFGLTIGGGSGLAIGQSGRLTLDLRYTIGLADVFEDTDEAAGSGAVNYVNEEGKALEFKNSDIRLMVGFQF